MSKHAVMPLTDYVNVCDALREKTGTTEPIKSGDIPQKVNDIYDIGKLATLKDSRYMNGKESGTIVSVNDVTPIEHNVGVKVASKNLFRPNYADYTQNRFYSYVYVGSVNMRMSFTDKDTTVDVSGIQVGFMEDINNVQGGANWAFKSGEIQANNSNVSSINKLVLCPYIVIYPNTEDAFNRITARYDIQVEIGDTATPYTPYVADLTGVEVARYGKNWFDNEKLCLASAYKTLYNGYYYTDDIQLLPNTTYIMRCNNSAYIESALYFVLAIGERKNSANTFLYPVSNGYLLTVTFTTTESGIISFGVSAYNGGVESNLSKIFSNDRRFQLELGTTATEYEPYKEPITYTANADGTVEGVKSISPNMTLIPNNNAVTVECEYLRDIDLYIDNLLKSVAMIGGE